MTPRPNLHADDIVTPMEAARLLRVPVNTIRVWIHRNRDDVQPLGKKGRWNAYDYNQIAQIEARMRRHAA